MIYDTRQRFLNYNLSLTVYDVKKHSSRDRDIILFGCIVLVSQTEHVRTMYLDRHSNEADPTYVSGY